MQRQFWLLTIMAVFVLLSACSGEGEEVSENTGKVAESVNQIKAEFKQPDIQQSIDKTRDLTASSRESSSADNRADQDKSSVDKSVAAVGSNAVNNEIASKETAVADTVAEQKKRQEEAAAEFALEMQRVEEELAAIDDSQLMQRYGAEGSGLAIKSRVLNLKLGPNKLKRTAVALDKKAQELVSNVTSVSGATSIVGDPSGFGFSVGLSGDYLFEFDKDSLTPEAQESLESILTLYKDYEGQDIDIIGHTDSKGSQEYNQGLSERRAASVKKWFVSSGIGQSLIKTKGLGESSPVAPNTKNGQDFPEGRAQNRRVEIKVKTNKKVNHLPTVSDKSKLNR